MSEVHVLALVLGVLGVCAVVSVLAHFASRAIIRQRNSDHGLMCEAMRRAAPRASERDLVAP